MIVISDQQLVLAMEFKSQVEPSFGNNFNNRSEEAIGSATCLWTAYREGRFGTAPRPFLGYFFLLSDCSQVKKPVRNKKPYFDVDPVFKGEAVERNGKQVYTGISYSQRYEILIRRLVRENVYTAACLLLTTNGNPTEISQPAEDLTFQRFVAALRGHVITFWRVRRERKMGTDPSNDKRFVLLVQPDGSFLVLPCPAAGSMAAENIAQIESIVPSTIKRNVSAIGNTEIVSGQKKPVAVGGPDVVRAVGQAIPFFGLLIGMAYVGHTVRVFNGRTPALASGCKAADVLIVDSALEGQLGEDWKTVASAAMRNANIFIHDRPTYKLRIVQKVGTAPDRIEFR